MERIYRTRRVRVLDAKAASVPLTPFRYFERPGATLDIDLIGNKTKRKLGFSKSELP